jgi:hypothetical protein
VIEVIGTHHSEHRAEAFGDVEPRTGLHSDAHGRRPQVVTDATRLDQPTFARIELREPSQQFRRRFADQRPNDAANVGGRPNDEASSGVRQPFHEHCVVVQRRLDDRQTRGRALLAGVSERRSHEIADCQIEVSGLGNDDRVLAAGLGK